MANSCTDANSLTERLLFSEVAMLPITLLRIEQLKPTSNLTAVFDECHNYVYANEGLLNDKIFNEMVKILVMKLYDEENCKDGVLRFGITAEEYKDEVLGGSVGSFRRRISGLFREVREKYASFLVDNIFKLEAATLAHLVSRLQSISLTHTAGDVKGAAFQAFVSRHQRGGRGEFFTPHPVVKLAVKMIAPKPHERVIDPACGSGGFLIETIGYVQREYPDVETGRYVRSCIRGIEFNPDIAVAAMLRLAFEGGDGDEILCRNALVEGGEERELFDVVLTNPPFGSKGKIGDREILSRYVLARKWKKMDGDRWTSTQAIVKGQSPDILFIEKCLRILRPGGRMAVVLPDGLLQNTSSDYVRSWMRSEAEVLGVVSLPQETFIPYGTGIKTSLLLLRKKPTESATFCFMARMKRMGYDVKGQTVYKRNEKGEPFLDKEGNRIVDDDVSLIASSYEALMNGEKLEGTNGSVYRVKKDLLNLRLDVEHYDPDDQSLILHVKSLGAKQLGEVAEIVKSPVCFRRMDQEIRYIAISDVDARTMQVVSQQSMRAHEAPSRATYQVFTGDIITAVSGASTGTARHATALITEDEDGAICSNGFVVLRRVTGVEPYFLLAYMRTEHYLRQVRRLMTGHAIPCISMNDLSRVLVPVLPRKKQEEIAQRIEEIYYMLKDAREATVAIIAETEQVLT